MSAELSQVAAPGAPALRWKPYPAYKDSGVEWLGKVPEHWEVWKIKHSTYVKGRIGWKGLSSNDFLDQGAYLVTGTDFIDRKVNWDTCYHVSYERFNEDPYIQLKEKDILITKDGTIGKIAIVENLLDKATLNSGIFVIRPLTTNYLNDFMYWVLNSEVFSIFIDYTKTGSTIQHLYQNVFEDFSFPVPPLPEQRAIARFLDDRTRKIDSLTEKKQKLIELLKEERAAVINEAVTKGLDPRAPVRDSGVEWLGKVPEKWEVKKLKYEISFLDSKRIPLSADERGKMIKKEYDYYGASGVIDKVENYIFDDTLILLGEDGANLLTRSTPLAFIASGRFWVNNHAHILKPKKGNIRYFVNLLESLDYDIYVTGSAQPKLTQENLENILIPVPKEDEQNKIVQFIESESTKTDHTVSRIEKEITLLQEYRTALISEVVTGKIDVRSECEIEHGARG